MTTETDLELKSIPGYSGYKVTCDGDVWSFRRKNPRKLRPDTHRQGYFRVFLLNDDGHTSWVLVHRLVAMAWIGPVPDKKPYVLHGDSNPQNNHFTNLRYGDHSDNMKDSYNNGNTAIRYMHGDVKGEVNGNSKLKNKDVLDIKQRLKTESCNEVSKDYGVSQSAIENIKYGRTWRHIGI